MGFNVGEYFDDLEKKLNKERVFCNC